MTQDECVELLGSDLPTRVDALAAACDGLAMERDTLLFMLPMAKRATGAYFEHQVHKRASEMGRHARVILLLVKP